MTCSAQHAGHVPEHRHRQAAGQLLAGGRRQQGRCRLDQSADGLEARAGVDRRRRCARQIDQSVAERLCQPLQQLTLKPPTENSAGLRFGNLVQIRDIWAEEIEAALSGQKTAQKALDDAVARGNQSLRQFERAVSR